MSPAHVLEPAYRKLKCMLMEGVWPPGERLDPLRLGDELGISMTPVRDCLNRLAGEQLVEIKAGRGYRVPRASEKILRDMLAINGVLLEIALVQQGAGLPPNRFEPIDQHYADRVARLFDFIASRSGNVVLAETVRSLGERMHVFRIQDSRLFAGALQELDRLEQLTADANSELGSSLQRYHDLRHRNAGLLIESIHENHQMPR
jgi:DNA-binding GntR family transcriptional regulator